MTKKSSGFEAWCRRIFGGVQVGRVGVQKLRDAYYEGYEDALKDGDAAMTEQELTLLIDYHDNQDAAAEAYGANECSLYHAKRSQHYTALRDAIKKRAVDTLAKMLASTETTSIEKPAARIEWPFRREPMP